MPGPANLIIFSSGKYQAAVLPGPASPVPACLTNNSHCPFNQQGIGGKFSLVEVEIIFQPNPAISTLGGGLGHDVELEPGYAESTPVCIRGQQSFHH